MQSSLLPPAFERLEPAMATVRPVLLLVLCVVAVDAIKVRVGHIGAVNAMPKAEGILEICRKELWKEGILSEDFDLE